MAKKFLIITEGAQTEQSIFEAVLTRYGFNVVKKDRITIDEEVSQFNFSMTELNDCDKDTVFIAQGPKNRLRELLKIIDTSTEDVERYFLHTSDACSGIFLVYDVDHTSKEDLELIYSKFRSENTGLLILNSPCIEILSEPNRTEEIKVSHLKEYKKERTTKIHALTSDSVVHYIINNFEELVIPFLKRNCEDSGSNNVMEHPDYVLNQINIQNIRTFISNENQPVLYRYFTTTLYTCIAYILGLTKETENSQQVEEYFKTHIRKLTD